MRIEVYHASKYGNGARVAEEFKRVMTTMGAQVAIHHIRDARPKDLPPADLYVFVSPARIMKPIGSMRRFLKKVNLPSGTRYALVATHGGPQPDKKTGITPSMDEMERFYTTIQVLTSILSAKGWVKVADLRVFVVNMKGPLEDGWEGKVEAFANRAKEGLEGEMPA